jgi:hypothetical protein
LEGGAWETLAVSSSPITDGVLGGWDTRKWQDGSYILRLSVTDTLGLTGYYPLRVVVDNEAPWMNETTPAVVSTVMGGHVYTEHAEVHIYFPPRAFRRDTEVRVTALTDSLVPATLANGAVRVLAGHEIKWDSPLSKAGTLEMSCAANGITPVVYVFGADSTWLRVGGTVEETGGSSGTGSSGAVSHISAAITEPGRYALFLEPAGAGAQGAGTLSALSLTPRVFAPNGTFANDHVAIAFTLGRSAPVTIKVYNRAGRLVRELLSGETLGAGANLVRWDGGGAGTNFVSDGLYLIVVDALGQKQSSTIAVVR